MDSEYKIIPVNLFFVCYEPKCAENKPPIIFIHGVLSSPYCWNKVRNKICDKTGRKGYALCMRNHGSSDWSEEMSVIHMAADVKHFMMKERISKALLIAHSLGGRVALAVALENPEMIEKIIIEDMRLTTDDNESRYLGFTSILQLAASSLKEFPSSVSETLAQKKLQHLFTFAWSKKPTEKACSRPMTPRLPIYKDKSGKFAWEINIDVVTKMFGTMKDLIVPFKEDTVYNGESLFIAAEYSAFEVAWEISINLPTYILPTEKEHQVSFRSIQWRKETKPHREAWRLKETELIKKHFPNSQFVCAKGVYHSCHLEKPEEYVDIVTKFLAQ